MQHRHIVIFSAQTIYGIEQYNEIRPDCLMIHPYLPSLLMCHRVRNSHEFGHKIWYKQVIIFAHHNFASLHIYTYSKMHEGKRQSGGVSLRPWNFFEDLAKYPLPLRRKNDSLSSIFFAWHFFSEQFYMKILGLWTGLY